jgi:hypothetical protein
MQPVLDQQRRGFFYNRHQYGHSEDCFVQLDWMWSFRLDRSFLAFTNRSGYGVAPGEIGYVNDLYAFSWDPRSTVDTPGHYEVRLVGAGTADVTLRRLQRFEVAPGAPYTYWLDSQAGPGTTISADQDGLLTIPGLSGELLLVVEPAAGAGPLFADGFESGSTAAWSAVVPAATRPVRDRRAERRRALAGVRSCGSASARQRELRPQPNDLGRRRPSAHSLLGACRRNPEPRGSEWSLTRGSSSLRCQRARRASSGPLWSVVTK